MSNQGARQQAPRRSAQPMNTYRRAEPPHHHKGLWTIAVIVIVLIGCFGFYHHQEASQQPKTAQTSQNNQNNQSNQNDSNQQNDPSSPIMDSWTDIDNIASNHPSASGVSASKELISHYKGGKSNQAYQSVAKLANDWRHQPNVDISGQTMTPHVKSVHKDGNHYDVTYQVDYFFPDKHWKTFDQGLHDAFIWHATVTKDGQKIITNKADNSHPVYKHDVNHHIPSDRQVNEEAAKSDYGLK